MSTTARRFVLVATAGLLTAVATAGAAQAAPSDAAYPPVAPPQVQTEVAGVKHTAPAADAASTNHAVGELAYTGADVAPWAAGGLGLLLAGGGLLVAAHRRTSA